MILKKIIASAGKSKPGFVEYSTPGTYTFTVPDGWNYVDLCMIGGGGSGAGQPDISIYATSNYAAGGGFAGELINQRVFVTPKSQVTVVVGSGGAAKYQSGQGYGLSGNPGANSSFGAVVAAGGSGGYRGTTSPQNYAGNGESRVTCNGTFNNGNAATYVPTNPSYLFTAYGGQAGLGNGGNGYVYVGGGDGSAFAGTRGGGGGGCLGTGGDNGATSGAGGNGYIKISWGL